MRIGVNAVPLRVSGGGARYVFTELMGRLLTLDQGNDYLIFTHFLGLPVVNLLPQVHTHLANGTMRQPARVVEVGCEEDIFRFRDQFDVFFGPLNNLQPRIYDRPSVAILHDIQEQYFPQYFSESDLRARHEIYPEICRSATTLVTISEFCRQSIVEKFSIEPEKIEVVYNAPQSRLVERRPGDDGTWRRPALPPRFFFYPANCYQHKNHALLLDALGRLREKGATCPGVVFTGFELPNGFPLRAEIERRGLQDLCRVYNEVHVDELRYLYRHALALVMPTLFEGFGMPAVEALACGCPVICSDLPPLREVAGEQALFFEPNNVARLVERMEQLAGDEALRTRLATAGPDAVRRFSWDRSAQRMLEILSQATTRFHGGPVHAAVVAEHRPRIGVLVTAARGGHGVPEALKGIWQTGYSNVAVTVALPSDAAAEPIRQFLAQTEVPYTVAQDGQLASWPRVREFAEQQGLDLVFELLAGHNRLLPTALHSLAWAYHREPDYAVYVGESWELEDERIARTARLRQLHTGDWKLDNFLYPEMVALSPRRLSAWDEGRQLLETAGPDWRWALVKAAHRAGRLCIVRRTLALCDPTCAKLLERVRAVRAGSEVMTADGTVRGGGWLHGLKPMLRPMSRVLPGRLREKGKRIWNHLANEG